MYTRHDTFLKKKTPFLASQNDSSSKNAIAIQDHREKSTAEKSLVTQLQQRSGNVIQLGKNQNTNAKKKAKNTFKKLIKKPKKKTTKKVSDTIKRPSFSADSKKSAILFHNLMYKSKFKIDIKKPNLTAINAAQPHRLSWKDIRNVIMNYHNNTKGSKSNLKKMVSILTKAGKERILNIKKKIISTKTKQTKDGLKSLLKRAESSQKKFITAYDDYIAKNNVTKRDKFMKEANSFHANVPDYGPHFGVNQPVSAAVHLNLRPSKTRKRKKGKKSIRPRSPSPMSRGILESMPKSIMSDGIAMSKSKDIITTDGKEVPISSLQKKYQTRIKKLKQKTINSFDPNAKFG